MSEGIEAVKDAKKFLEENNAKIIISRIPKKTKERFVKLANEEFCSDYGMCLKYLTDVYFGMIPTGNELAEMADAKAEEALAQIAELKQMVGKPTEEKKVIRLCNGKERVI